MVYRLRRDSGSPVAGGTSVEVDGLFFFGPMGGYDHVKVVSWRCKALSRCIEVQSPCLSSGLA